MEKVVSLQEIQEEQEPEAFKSGRLMLGTTATSTPPDVYKKQRVARIFVYIGICGCLGLLSYLAFAPAPTASNTPVVQSVEQKASPEPLSFYGAEWEAMSFATHWLSGNREKAQGYAAKGFEIPQDAVKVDPGVKVTAVAPGNVKSLGNNKYAVTVKAYMQRKKEQYMIRLAVPMIIKDGSIGVYDYPNYVPKIDRPQVTIPEDKNEEALEKPLENEVREVTESFYRLFAQGNSGDLGLLFTDGQKRSSIPGKFEGIKDFKAFKDGERVKVESVGLLNIGGVTTFQPYEIIFSKDEGSWKIDKTRPSLPTER